MAETVSSHRQWAKIAAVMVTAVATLVMSVRAVERMHPSLADEAVASGPAGAAPPTPGASDRSHAAPTPARSAGGDLPRLARVPASGAPVVHPIYRTQASLPLAQATHGFDGTLRLLEDARARRPNGHEPGVPMHMTEGFLHGRLELLDASGRPVDAFELWSVLAGVREMGLSGAPRGSFFVELDPECFGSSFCGKDTEILDVSAGKLAWVSSVDAETQKSEPIVLRDSVMSGWRPSPAASGKPLEIFWVASTQTVTAYVRYTLEGSRWIKRYRQRPGPDPPGNPGNERSAFDPAKFPQAAAPPGP